jgi:hypothetical protein
MSQKMTKLILILISSFLAYYVLNILDPDLLDPSSDESLFAVFSSVSGPSGMDVDLSKTNSSADLLGAIRRSFTINDSARAAQSGERDVMRPLVSLEMPQIRANRRAQAPKPVQRFPLSRKDIKGIAYNGRKPASSQVFIMGQRYKIGDSIKGALIKSIDKTSVTFDFLKKSIVIELSSKLN